MIAVNVVKTGSKGNAVILNDSIMIDCGVPYKEIAQYAAGLKLVLLSHFHFDHFNRAAIKKLAREYPLLRFGCGEWLVEKLLECGVGAARIDVYDMDVWEVYSGFDVEAIQLVHDKPNCGYKMAFHHRDMSFEKVFYATDTANLDGINAPNYDLYLIEANYSAAEVAERIKAKEAAGEYVYEYRAIANHLSREAAEEWIGRNAGDKSTVIYLHEHGGGALC